MPRCRDGKWCIDDLCHFTEQTLCGLWTDEDHDGDGEWSTDDEDEWGDEGTER